MKDERCNPGSAQDVLGLLRLVAGMPSPAPSSDISAMGRDARTARKARDRGDELRRGRAARVYAAIGGPRPASAAADGRVPLGPSVSTVNFKRADGVPGEVLGGDGIQ